MDADIRISVQDAVEALRQLHKEGVIDDKLLYKGLVSLAYEYAVNDEVSAMTKLLLEVPLSYYRDGDQLQHICDDLKYAAVCQEMARLMSIHDVVDTGLSINHPPGIA